MRGSLVGFFVATWVIFTLLVGEAGASRQEVVTALKTLERLFAELQDPKNPTGVLQSPDYMKAREVIEHAEARDFPLLYEEIHQADKPAWYRRHLLLEVARRRDPQALPTCVGVLQNVAEPDLLRESVIGSLIRLSDAAGIPPLLHALEDPSRAVRLRVAEALLRLPHETVRDALLKRLKVEPDEIGRMHLVASLQPYFGQEDVVRQVIAHTMKEETPGVWDTVIRLLGRQYKDPRVVPLIMAALRRENPKWSLNPWDTGYVLAQLGDRAALEELQTLLVARPIGGLLDTELTKALRALQARHASKSPFSLGVEGVKGSEGLRLTLVRPLSPASAADLRVGDFLLTLERTPLVSFEQLDEQIKRYTEGTVVKIGYQRGGIAAIAQVSLLASPRSILPDNPQTLPALLKEVWNLCEQETRLRTGGVYWRPANEPLFLRLRAVGAGHLPELLEEVLNPRHPWLYRTTLLKTLRGIGNASVVKPLLPLLQDPTPLVRGEVADLFDLFKDPQVVPALCEALEKETEGIPLGQMAQALRDIQDERAVAPLLRRLSIEKNKFHRGDLVRALGAFNMRKEVVEALQEALRHDPEVSVRIEAVQALIIKRRSSTTPILKEVPFLKEVIADMGQLPAVRAEAVTRLAERGGPEALAYFSALWRQPLEDHVLRQAVQEALRRVIRSFAGPFWDTLLSIGLLVGETSPGAPSIGLTVKGVDPASPADRAGFHLGDVLVAVEGRPVSNPGECEKRLQEFQVGSRLKFGVVRGTQSLTLQVVTEVVVPPEKSRIEKWIEKQVKPRKNTEENQGR